MEPDMFIIRSVSDAMYTDGSSWAYNPEELRPMSYEEAQKVRRQLYRKSRVSDEFEIESYERALIGYRQDAMDWKIDDE
jgi:hypothetical protein